MCGGWSPQHSSGRGDQMEASSTIPTRHDLPTVAFGVERRGSIPIVSEESASATPYCFQCEYNLTGIESGRCPECGWVIDWNVAFAHEELRRIGTPAHRAKGWKKIPAALATVALMLFRPVKFARRLRYDESLWPAAGIAVAAYFVFIADAIARHGLSLDDYETLFVYGSGIAACILTNCLLFATISQAVTPLMNWRRRFRVFLLVSLYGTCFVGAWSLIKGPPLVMGVLSQFNFLIPFEASKQELGKLFSDPEFLGRTIIFYWHSVILTTFAFVRGGRWWRPSMFLVAPFASNVAARIVGEIAFGIVH